MVCPIIEYLKKGYFDNNVPKEEGSQTLNPTPYMMDNCISEDQMGFYDNVYFQKRRLDYWKISMKDHLVGILA